MHHRVLRVVASTPGQGPGLVTPLRDDLTPQTTHLKPARSARALARGNLNCIVFHAFTILVLLITCVLANAQQYSVKIGTIGHRDQQMTVGAGWGGVQNMVARNVLDDSTLNFLGPIWACYTVTLDSLWSVGAEVGYHEAKGRWLSDDTNPASGGRAIPVPYGKQTVHIAACAELAWFHRRWFTLSSSGSLGIALSSHDGNNVPLGTTEFAYHLGLVSMRVVGDVAFRLEVGYGYRGLINAGMSFLR